MKKHPHQEIPDAGVSLSVPIYQKAVIPAIFTWFIAIALGQLYVVDIIPAAGDMVTAPVVILTAGYSDDAGVLPEEADFRRIISNTCGVPFIEAFGAPGLLAGVVGVPRLMLQLLNSVFGIRRPRGNCVALTPCGA